MEIISKTILLFLFLSYIYLITNKNKMTMDTELLDVTNFDPKWVDDEYQYQHWKQQNQMRIELEEEIYWLIMSKKR